MVLIIITRKDFPQCGSIMCAFNDLFNPVVLVGAHIGTHWHTLAHTVQYTSHQCTDLCHNIKENCKGKKVFIFSIRLLVMSEEMVQTKSNH